MSKRATIGFGVVLLVAGCASRAAEPAAAPQADDVPKAAQGAAPESNASQVPSPSSPSVVTSERSPTEEAAPSRVASRRDDAPADKVVDLEAARRMLDAGEREVLQLVASADGEKDLRGYAEAESKPTARAKKVAADEAGPAPAAAGRPSAAPAGGGASDASQRCVVACKALASMRRAADRMCELVGAGDAQCADARGRVSRSVARVEGACPVCSDAR